MKAIIGKTAVIFMSLMGLGACSMGTYVQSKHILDEIHPGMTYEQVSNIMGKPDYRRFNREHEEWEYRKWLSGSNAIVIVGFEEGRVTSMDSFENPQSSQTPPTPVTPVVIPEQHPSYPAKLYRMSDAEFQKFYQEVKSEPFSDERNDMIRALSQSKRLTCRQCAQLLTFYSYEDEKMTAFQWFAPHIVDKENYKEIQKQFDFSSGQDKVKQALGI